MPTRAAPAAVKLPRNRPAVSVEAPWFGNASIRPAHATWPNPTTAEPKSVTIEVIPK